MNYAQLRLNDVTNGPGIRITLFVSGCELNCKGCFNKEAQDYCYGKEFNEDILNTIITEANKDRIYGLSVLGGDPFAKNNIETVHNIVCTFKKHYPNKTIYMWTGYTIEQLLKRKCIYTIETLKKVDMLIDGPFILAKRDLTLHLRGSSNQRLLTKEKISEYIRNAY